MPPQSQTQFLSPEISESEPTHDLHTVFSPSTTIPAAPRANLGGGLNLDLSHSCSALPAIRLEAGAAPGVFLGIHVNTKDFCKIRKNSYDFGKNSNDFYRMNTMLVK
jgi:hypothetical protein